MLETSQFSDSQPQMDAEELMITKGATCDTFRVKLYGKLHFLKRLKADYARDIRFQEAFRKEFETGYRLEHPNIVRYIFLTDDGLLMEYIDGETLTQALVNHPDYFQNKKNTDRILCQLLDAVAYLHSHQILHLDLKPDNVMLTRIGHDVKLVDLGFSYTDTFTDTTGHTDSFAAPEQLTGSGVDERTDIDAIGKLIELLPNHTIYNKVIVRCTKLAPQDRYQSVGDVLRAVTHQRHYLLLGLALAFPVLLAVASVAVYHSAHQSVIAPVDTIAVGHVTEDSVSPPSAPSLSQPSLPSEIPAKSVVQKDDRALMVEEAARLIDQAYRQTIASFQDSVFSSPSSGGQWSEASIAFHDQVVRIGDQLVSKYPQLSEGIIRQETMTRFESLVIYVGSKMRENDQRLSNPPED